MNSENKEFKIDNTILNKSAHQNPFTVKPVIKKSAKSITIELITNRKTPNDKMVKGMVNNINKGLTVKFKRDKTRETKIATQKLDTSTPGRI